MTTSLTLALTVGGIFFVIISILAFFVTISSHKEGKAGIKGVKRRPPAEIELNKDVGGSTDGQYVLNNGDDLLTEENCLAVTGTNWSGSHCRCNIPFFGSECQRESHNSNYKTLSHFDLSELGHTKLRLKNNMRLSFNSDGTTDGTCTELCDNDCECDGVHFADGVCTLLSNIFYSGDFINHSDTSSIPNIYLKNRVKFKNRVFLWEGVAPVNYWSAKKTKDFLPLDKNEIECETKAPQFIINDTGDSILISSEKDFPKSETVRIHGCFTDGHLLLPHEWTHPESGKKFFIKFSQ